MGNKEFPVLHQYSAGTPHIKQYYYLDGEYENGRYSFFERKGGL